MNGIFTGIYNHGQFEPGRNQAFSSVFINDDHASDLESYFSITRDNDVSDLLDDINDRAEKKDYRGRGSSAI